MDKATKALGSTIQEPVQDFAHGGSPTKNMILPIQLPHIS